MDNFSIGEIGILIAAAMAVYVLYRLVRSRGRRGSGRRASKGIVKGHKR